MAASTPYTKLLLRKIHREAAAATQPIGEALSVFGDARVTQTSTGNQILSASGGGKTVTFAAPSPDFSQVDLAETASRLLDLFDTVAATLAVDTGDPNNNDAIFTAMLLRLRAVKTVQTQFTAYQV